MQMIIILILIGVGGWLIWDHTEKVKELEAANVQIVELNKKVEEGRKQLETVIVAYGKVAPGPAAEIAKRLDMGQAPGAHGSTLSKIVPKMSPMEERRNKGPTLLDGNPNNNPAAGRR